MDASNIFQFFLPLISGVYFYFKDIKKFTLVFFISYGLRSGINIWGVQELRVKEVFYIFILFFLIKELFLKKKPIKINTGGRIIALLFLFLVLHTLLGLNTSGKRVFYNIIFLFIQYPFILAIIKTTEDWKTLIKYFIISNIFILLYTILVLLFPSYLALEIQSSLTTTENYVRFYTMGSAYILFFASLIFLSGIKSIIFTFLTFFAIILSGSRNLLLSVIIVFIYFVWIKKTKTYGKSIIFSLSIIKIIPFVLIIFLALNYLTSAKNLPLYFTRYKEFIENPGKAGGRRLLYYQNALSIIKENPFRWNKISQSKELRKQYDKEWAFVFAGQAHSTPISITYAYGLLGLFTLYSMVFYYFFRSKKIYIQSIYNSNFLLLLHLLFMVAIVQSFLGGGYYNLIGGPIILALLTFSFLKKEQLFHRSGFRQKARP